MMDNFISTSSLTDQIEWIVCDLVQLELDLRSIESAVEFELVMVFLAETRKALEALL